MSNKKKMEMSQNGDWEIYREALSDNSPSKHVPRNYTADSTAVFSNPDGSQISIGSLLIGKKNYEYVNWGDDNMLPYKMRDWTQKNMVASRCQEFNYQACYGSGVRFYDVLTGKTTHDPSIMRFDLENNMRRLWLEMCIDIKMYYFSVVTFVLSNDGSKIVQMHHKDACNVRFSPKFDYIIYGLFEDGCINADDPGKVNAEVIPLLDLLHPFNDLMQRTGREPSYKDGLKHDTGQRRFAMVMAIPTVGQSPYPLPTWFSLLLDHWYNIYMLIGEGKERKIRNATTPRYQVEIHKDYWDRACDNKGIVDIEKRKEYVKQLKMEIEDFVCGNSNAGKTWITEYWFDPNGKETHMVKVVNLEDGKKEGGDWADDIQEAANIQCFVYGVHPNMIGATPGKSAMNNSGSDKRELFTLKQSLEIPFRDALLPAFYVTLTYNGWGEKVWVDAPILQLTTIDENKDAKQVVPGKEEE